MARTIKLVEDLAEILGPEIMESDIGIAYGPHHHLRQIRLNFEHQGRWMELGSSPETSVLEVLEQAEILTHLTVEVSHLRSDIGDSAAKLEAMVEELVTTTTELKESFEAQASVNTVHLISLHDDRYELKAPLPVILEEYEDEVIARWPELDLYYSADVASEALAGLESEIIQLYTELSSSSLGELGVLPKRWLKTLSKVVNSVA